MYILATIDLTAPSRPQQNYQVEHSLDEAVQAYINAREKLHQEYPLAQIENNDGYGELVKQSTLKVNNIVIATVGIYQPLN